MEVYENLDINDLDGEIWKVIKDFPDYQVSNLGRVKSFKKWHGTSEKILKQSKTNYDYLCVGLCVNGILKLKQVHRLCL